MKNATSLLLAGMLIFGLAAYAFVQNALVMGVTPWYGYASLMLSQLFGIALFAKAMRQKAYVSSLQEKVEALNNALNQSNTQAKAKKESEKEADTTAKHEEVMQLLNSTDFSQGIENVAEKLLIALAKKVSMAQGLLYVEDPANEGSFYPCTKYAYYSENEVKGFTIGEGINGQVAKDQQAVLLDSIPDNYITIVSGLGQSTPKAILLQPIVSEGKTIALLELAFLSKPSSQRLNMIKVFSECLGEKSIYKQLE